jgi:hypothetical protein
MLRRHFLSNLSAGLATAALGRSVSLAQPAKRPRVAALLTQFFHRSHAHVILENFLRPYLFNGRMTDPGADVVSFYVDQTRSNDMSRDVAREFKIPIYPTISEALCLGGKELAVDAVLSIAEHGDYPTNELGQREYPRKRFFDEIVAVFAHSGRTAPVFNDKHLSYRWDWSKEMYDTAVRMQFPLMAGSSVPLAERRPTLELPVGAKLRQAVSIHGGGVESYDFHGLEVLQSMVESRSGAETGISEVRFLQGDALWQAADAGAWSVPLAEAAMAAELGPGNPPLRELIPTLGGRRSRSPHGILLTYRDGLTAMVLALGSSDIRWNFACQLVDDDSPRATSFYTGPWHNRNLFKALSHAIQTHFRERQSPYSVERTLLTTGALAAAMQSRHAGGEALKTPHLEFAYQPRDYRAMREMGATWKIITEETQELPGINPNGGTPG